MKTDRSFNLQKALVVVVSLVITVLYTFWGGDSTPTISEDGLVVSRVVDGDTIELSNGKVVRYIGVNTPETVDPRRPEECFGKEASNKNKELVLGKEVQLETDVSDTDSYGRLLRYVYVDGVMINELLVAQGYAQASSYPPDIKYQSKFSNLERTARENEKGLWGNCDENSAVAGEVIREDGCVIKGNISQSGEKIYHEPGCRHYANTSIHEDSGEAWFCTPREAEAAGFRRAGNCD